MGVHAPDKLRDGSHPHSSLGSDKMKVGFHEGGTIGESIGDAFSQQSVAQTGFGDGGFGATLKGAVTQQAQTFGGFQRSMGKLTPPALPAARSRPPRGGRRANRYADGGKVRTVGEAAAAEKNPDSKASFGMAKRLSDASKRDRTPGHAKGSDQDRLQKRLFAASAAKEMTATARNNAAKKVSGAALAGGLTGGKKKRK